MISSEKRYWTTALRMALAYIGVLIILSVIGAFAVKAYADSDAYTIEEGYFIFTGDDSAWNNAWTGAVHNYIKGKNSTIVYEFAPYYSNEDITGSSGVFDIFYYWRIEEYIDGTATGRDFYLFTSGDENCLQLDSMNDCYWSDGNVFEWNDSTEYVFSVEAVEYLSGKESMTHVPLSKCVVTCSSNTVSNWSVELMNFVPNNHGTMEMNVEYGESRYCFIRSIDIRGTSGVQYTLDSLTFIQNETYRVKMQVRPKEGWTFSEDSKGDICCANGVVIGDITYDYYTDPLAGSVVDCSFNVTVNGQLTGAATLGAATLDGVSSWDVDTNATKGMQFLFLVNEVGYEADISSKAETAYNKIKARYGAGLLGQSVKLKVTAENYVGAIVSNSVTVGKTISYVSPQKPELNISGSSGSYTVTITNYSDDQDYVYSDSTIPMEEYGNIDFDMSVGQSFSISGGYVYVYTRMAETATTAGGEEIVCTASYAGEGGKAQGIVLDKYKAVVEAEEQLTISASILPLEQSEIDEGKINWYVADGNKESLKPVVNGKVVDWPGSGEGFVTGSQLTLEGIDFGIVEVGVSVTLSSGKVLNQSCTVIVTVDENAFVTSVVQPSETIYLYPGSTYTVNEYTVYPVEARGLWTPSFVVYYVEEDENRNWDMYEGGIFVISEECEPGTQIWFAPYYDNVYAYAYEGRVAEPSLRCIEVVAAESDIYFNKSEYTGLVDSTFVIGASTYGPGTLIFESSDSSVASVDENGNVTLEAEGTAVITGHYGSKSATCVINVVSCHHNYVYEDNGDGTHSTACDICGLVYNENHIYGNYIGIDGASHQKSCVCGVTVKENHVLYHEVSSSYGEETISDVCSVCGYAELVIRDILSHKENVIDTTEGNGTTTSSDNDGDTDDQDDDDGSTNSGLSGKRITVISEKISALPIWAWIVMIACVLVAAGLAAVIVLRQDMVRRKKELEQNKARGGN